MKEIHNKKSQFEKVMNFKTKQNIFEKRPTQVAYFRNFIFVMVIL